MSSQVIILIISVISTFDTIFCHDSHSTSKVKKAWKLLHWSAGAAMTGCHTGVDLSPSSRGERSEGKLVLGARAPAEGSLLGSGWPPSPRVFTLSSLYLGLHFLFPEELQSYDMGRLIILFLLCLQTRPHPEALGLGFKHVSVEGS